MGLIAVLSLAGAACGDDDSSGPNADAGDSGAQTLCAKYGGRDAVGSVMKVIAVVQVDFDFVAPP